MLQSTGGLDPGRGHVARRAPDRGRRWARCLGPAPFAARIHDPRVLPNQEMGLRWAGVARAEGLAGSLGAGFWRSALRSLGALESTGLCCKMSSVASLIGPLFESESAMA